MEDKILYIVIPCYNEEAVLEETARQLLVKMETLMKNEDGSGMGGGVSRNSRIVFINDGSCDRSWEIIQELHNANSIFSGINLSRNRGHQNALLAGLMTVKSHCDIAISMDADLQDDIRVIDKMIEAYYKGYDIVYGVRSKREMDTIFKRFTAESFYRLMGKMGAETVYNHADCRLMSRRALEGLAEFTEVNLFLRGLVPMIGYSSVKVYYERNERFAGESKYPLKKMLAFALEGITSLTTKPIKMIGMVGGLIFGVSIIMLIWSVIGYFNGTTVPGWASLMVSIWGIGGLLILSVGIVGEYIGKVYLETKRRPRYIIESFINAKNIDDKE